MHPPAQPPSVSQNATQIGGVKRPWLPMKQVIGLAAVAVFILGGITGSALLIPARFHEFDASRQALAAGEGEDIYSAMSRAMLEDDREDFLRWAEGPARDQLAQIWDGSKEVGWTVGLIDSVYEDDYNYDAESYDPSRPLPNGMRIAFDLGFTHTRAAADEDGPKPDCVASLESCGILTQSFDYDVIVDGGDGSRGSYRIIEIAARTPMPWDDKDGVYAVHSENSVLFGYADEADAIDAIAGDIQTAAAGVLQTEVATSGYSSVPGFPAFYSGNNERYQGAVYGVGEHRKEVARDWEEAGVTLVSVPLDVTHGAYELAEKRGVLLELGMFGGQSGSLAAFNGEKIASGGQTPLRVAAHEFAHALEMTTFSHMIFGETSSEDLAFSFGSEGYARYIEDLVASPHDGVQLTLNPNVRAAIVATPDAGLQGLVGAGAFRESATSPMAYDAAGNYFAFLAANGVDIAKVMYRGEYMMYDPYTWIGLHYPTTASGETIDATPAAWRSWNAR